MRNNDIRMMVKEALDNLWAHVKTMFSGLDTRVTALEQGGGGGGAVSGVKGDAESSYRTGQVNLTAANIGALPSNTTYASGVKGDAESSYRSGNVNLTPENIGAPARTDLTSIIATGTTNATGATIAKGTFFYLNGALVQAKADIASAATFTSGTNYEAVTAGGLNSLSAVSYDSVNGGQQSGTIKLVRCGKIRQLVFDDAKLPSNAGYFNIPGFSSNDSPYVLTGAILYINSNKVMFIWIRPNGSIGQISATAGDTVNGTLTWIVE